MKRLFNTSTLLLASLFSVASLQSGESTALDNKPICSKPFLYGPPLHGFQTYTLPTTHATISVWDSGGKGQPVLLVHGNSFSKEIFLHQFKSDLTKKYRLIAIDLPGHGQSEKAYEPEKTYNLEGYADVVKQVIQTLGLENPLAIGWSLGGHVLLNSIAKGQKFAGVLITGTPPIEVSFEGFKKGFLPVPKAMRLFSKVEFTTEEAIEFMTSVSMNIDLEKYPFVLDALLKTDGCARQNFAASLIKNNDADQKALVETNATPLCVVLGTNEKVNIDYVKEINFKNLFNQKIYLIENAGHAAFWDQPDQFNQILNDFLSHSK